MAKFEALIKKLELKSLVSNDRGCQILLQIDGADDELVKALVELHKADELVQVEVKKNHD
jgi:hypothetical protein